MASLSKPAARPTGFLNFNPQMVLSKEGSSTFKAFLTKKGTPGILNPNFKAEKVV
jgi:hypothetical protein